MKRIALLLSTIIIITGRTSTVYAAPKQMSDGNIFDAEFYAENNPDVVSVFGTDEAQLYQHYLLNGAAEGRLPYEGADISSITVINQADVKGRLDAVKAQYPQGSVWDDNTEYKGYYACQGFAVMLEELVFNCKLETPHYIDRLTYRSQVYPGCVYQTGIPGSDMSHIAVIIEVTSDGFIVAEGNNDGKVNYTRKIRWNSMINGIRRARTYEMQEPDCDLDDIAEYNSALSIYEANSSLIPTRPTTYRVWSCAPGIIAEPSRK